MPAVDKQAGWLNKLNSSPRRLNARVYSRFTALAMEKRCFPKRRRQVGPVVGVAKCSD
ncbi:hypothetical protein Poly59_49210 [Rubripirellula reticaptiva]|uniref:Uncharacterized protein n=1 Tax=Rubripirellula reticaptiva TaxID=2528013 RepID=A0A5C6EKA8_9BACT|nr:hypothetical protein Poly59_49210 [Rubripirellula reticaptiva]